MRVLLVFPDLAPDVTNYTGVASYGVASLTAALRAAGHQPSLLHLTHAPSREGFVESVRAARPDLVGFSVNSHYARRLGTWSRWVKEAVAVPVAVGGVHATLAPDEVSELPDVDFTCLGEGEAALTELCAALSSGGDPSAIPSLWARRNGRVLRNPVRAQCADLDAQPDPDLSLFDVPSLYPVRFGRFPYLMSRGCAFGCSYCCVHSLRKIAPRGTATWRFLSPRRAAQQLRALLDLHLPRLARPDAAEIHFLDAILFPNRDWLQEFGQHYRELVARPFSCNLRADFVDETTATLLADMGCTAARLGVESGDADISSRILTRGLSLDDLRRAFRLLRDRGIQRWSYNMVGLPDETLRRALTTVRFNAELDPELAIPFIFYPYPGTRLHQLCAERGYLTAKEYDHYFLGVTTRLPGFSESDILFVHRFFRPLMRLYGWARPWPAPLRRGWEAAVTATLTSPLFPRAALVSARERYKAARHSVGERVVRHSPALYRALGGRAPLAKTSRSAPGGVS